MGKFSVPERVVYICQGSKCSKKGAKECYKKVKDYLKHSSKKDTVEIIITECSDRCKYAPVLSLQPDNIWIKEYRVEEVLRLLESTPEQ